MAMYGVELSGQAYYVKGHQQSLPVCLHGIANAVHRQKVRSCQMHLLHS
jgi:hypothetical protein